MKLFSTCEICNKHEAEEQCEGCGRALCRQCRQMEIWGSGAEDLTIRYLCPACKEDPDINPWGAYDKVLEAGEAKQRAIRAA